MDFRYLILNRVKLYSVTNNFDCVICNEKYSHYIFCNNKKCKKSMCKSCFSLQTNSQLDYDNLNKFVKNKSKIVCSFCEFPYDDVIVCNNINKELNIKFDKLKKDLVIAQQQKKETKKIKHVNYICENILTLKTPCCQSTLLDFEGCFAIKCYNCTKYFCGWCLNYNSDGSLSCHTHVLNCKSSLNKNEYFYDNNDLYEIHKKK